MSNIAMFRDYVKYAENYYFNLNGCQLSENDMDECLNQCKNTLISNFITHLNIKKNNFTNYKISKILETFVNVKKIIVSDINMIEVDVAVISIEIICES